MAHTQKNKQVISLASALTVDLPKSASGENAKPETPKTAKPKKIKKERSSLICKTLHFKVRNPNQDWLVSASNEVNTVWNYANEVSYKAITAYHEPKFLSAYDLASLTSGSTYQELPTKTREANPNGFTHISSATVQEVCKEYATRREQFKKAKMNWRKSTGSEKSLGWIPFKQENITISWQATKLAGKITDQKPSQSLTASLTKQAPTKTALQIKAENLSKAQNLYNQLAFQAKSHTLSKKASKASIKVSGRHIHIYNEPYLVYHLVHLAANVVSGNLSQDSLGDWYLNLSVDIQKDKYLEHLESKGFAPVAPNESIGVDLGSNPVMGCSNGVVVEPPRFYQEAQDKLASLQKNGRLKQAKRLNRDIKNRREDFNQKTTTDIVKQNQTIKAGDLRVKEMVKRKKAKKKVNKKDQEKAQTTKNKSKDKTGNKKDKTKKHNRGPRFGKSMLDNGLGQIKAYLSVKSHWAGRSYHEVCEKYTTQVCSNCDAFTGPKGLKQLVDKTWECTACGTVHDRDVCAGQNIVRVIPGQTLLTSVPRCGHLFAEMKTLNALQKASNQKTPAVAVV